MRILKLIVLTIAFLVIIALVSAGAGYYYIIRTLPGIEILDDYKPNMTTRVYADDGQLIAEFFIERRTVVPLRRMPKHLKEAFLAAEDAKFYSHKGLDYPSILRAFYKNLQAGKIVQGGSTITQQVAKSFFLTSERKISRKIREAVMASRMEKHLTKDEILHLYLNQIYFGHGSYGVQAASFTYFNKDVSELSVSESALLAALPKAPTRYSPYVNPAGAKKRQEFVLTRMYEEGYISKSLYVSAKNEPLVLKSKKAGNLWVAPYFSEHIRRYIEDKYGNDMLYRGGLSIYTTLNVDMQKVANRAVTKGLKAHDRRRGYRGPIKVIKSVKEMDDFVAKVNRKLKDSGLTAGVTSRAVIASTQSEDGSFLVNIGSRQGIITKRDMKWATRYNPTADPNGAKKTKLDEIFHAGDVIEVEIKKTPPDDGSLVRLRLTQEPLAQAALLSMKTDTGEIKAMVGGYDFSKSEYNRTIQSMRQPGSAFKPIIYAAAIDRGYTPATIVIDSPLVFEEEVVKKPSPDDAPAYEESSEFDPVEANDGPIISTWKPRNFGEKFYGPTTIRKALTKSRNVVTVKVLRDIGVRSAIKYARKLGITAPLAHDLSLALGSSSLSLLELTGAFATFDNAGNRAVPIFITRITDKNGNVIEENTPQVEPAISAQTAYIITSMLQGVVEHGTGWRAKALKRPVSGKTGTTNNLNDAWFMGYIPGFVTGTWIGYDSERPLGRYETGSKAAAPIWVNYMLNVIGDMPPRDFPIPDGVEFAKIDPKSGKLATSKTKDPIFEVFKVGTKPTRSAPERNASSPDDFFMLDAEQADQPEPAVGLTPPDESPF